MSSYRRPSFYDPTKVGTRFKPQLDLAAEEALASDLKPALDDWFKRLLFIIDAQVDFVAEFGSLYVRGSVEDIRHLIAMIIERADTISGIMISLDQHLPLHIWSQAWWDGRDGSAPKPFTEIIDEDVRSGLWIPAYKATWSMEYPSMLKARGQEPLRIWPAHCKIGTEGANLDPALAEVLEWLCVARGIEPTYILKGSIAKVEHYGPFAPCVLVPDHPQGVLNTQALDEMISFDAIDVCGEAEDYCVKQGLLQMVEHFKSRHPEVLRRTHFLSDCTSLVIPDQRPTAENFKEELRSHGVKIVKSTSI